MNHVIWQKYVVGLDHLDFTSMTCPWSLKCKEKVSSHRQPAGGLLNFVELTYLQDCRTLLLVCCLFWLLHVLACSNVEICHDMQLISSVSAVFLSLQSYETAPGSGAIRWSWHYWSSPRTSKAIASGSWSHQQRRRHLRQAAWCFFRIEFLTCSAGIWRCTGKQWHKRMSRIVGRVMRTSGRP